MKQTNEFDDHGDAEILWRAVVEVCGGTVQREIKEAYQRLAHEQESETEDETREIDRQLSGR